MFNPRSDYIWKAILGHIRLNVPKTFRLIIQFLFIISNVRSDQCCSEFCTHNKVFGLHGFSHILHTLCNIIKVIQTTTYFSKLCPKIIRQTWWRTIRHRTVGVMLNHFLTKRWNFLQILLLVIFSR